MNPRLPSLLLAFAAAGLAQDLAITGATLIDGNGGPPLPNSAVLISAGRITALGPRAFVRIPSGTRTIDATGRYLVPGFIDTNVHLSLYGGVGPRYETLAKYYPRQDEIVLEAAQIQLAHGVTTVRDSYGMLMPLTRVRDRIERGEALGARILAAGNIVGWGGPFSTTFSLYPQAALTRFQEEMNDAVALDAGENLADLSAEELRAAIDKYLDKTPDFLKYGGTSHFSQPSFIGFSPEAQKVMVDEAHKRGMVAETHSTTIEGLRLSILAGIDLIQHPELMTPRALPDELVRLIKERNIINSMLVSSITGEAWEKHLKTQADLAKKEAEKKPGPPRTTVAERKRAAELETDLETRRANAIKIIRAGNIVTPGTDSYWASAPEFQADPKPDNQSHGIGTIMAIEGLVELGMTPAQAITAGTKNGALAARLTKDIGTIEKGILADLVLLDADPLADIHNIRKVHTVFKAGRPIDPATLPERRVLSTPPVPAAAPAVAKSPDNFHVRLETTKGNILLEVHRDWAPNGADRFYNLVISHYYDGNRWFRVVKGRWAQFGINGDPAVAKAWRDRPIPDDPRKQSNVRGTVAFAFAVPNGRTTQVYINTGDNAARNDPEPFSPFAKVTGGMEVADALCSDYAETSGGGIRAGKQAPLFEQGNYYLDRHYPALDRIERAVLLP